MQTQSPQSLQFLQPNKLPQPAQHAAPQNTGADFRQALTRELDRPSANPAPEPATPQGTAQNAPARAKPVQQQKPAQQANQARQADDAQQPAEADKSTVQDGTAPADAQPTRAAAGDDKAADAATDEAIAAAAADPMANMLAMLAAYNQLTPAEPAAAQASDTAGDAATGLAALQADAAGKRSLPDLAAKDLADDARGAAARPDDASQPLQPQGADTDGLAATAPDPQALGTEQKAEAFAAKLADAKLADTKLADAKLADTAPAQPALPPGAQAMAATAQAAQAVAGSQLQARVGSNAWEQQLGQKVVWMVAGGDQSASLTLNPPDLGPLQVVLKVTNDSATATFTAHQPETRQAIENALPKLREMMGEAGISLGDASVSAGTQDQQRAFAEQARGSGRSGGRGYGEGSDTGQQDAAQPVIRHTVLGAVDTFA